MSHRNAVIVRKIIERTHVHIQKKIRQYAAYRNISLLDASDTVRGNRSPSSIASSLDEYPPFPHISANLEDSQLYSSSKSSISSRTRTFYAKAASEYMNSAIKHSSPSRKDVRRLHRLLPSPRPSTDLLFTLNGRSPKLQNNIVFSESFSSSQSSLDKDYNSNTIIIVIY